jgi:hypothetical protein
MGVSPRKGMALDEMKDGGLMLDVKATGMDFVGVCELLT